MNLGIDIKYHYFYHYPSFRIDHKASIFMGINVLCHGALRTYGFLLVPNPLDQHVTPTNIVQDMEIEAVHV